MSRSPKFDQPVSAQDGHGARTSKATALSLFSGAGGLDAGLERAAFRMVGCVEEDADCRATLRRNRPAWPQLTPGDVFAHTPADILSTFGIEPGELTLVAGGPPCQPFSKSALWVNGTSRGMADPRARTLNAYMSVVEAALPEAMLLENVKGIGFAARGRKAEDQALDMLRTKLAAVNAHQGTSYEPIFLRLDAADYGIPQHRERLFIFAARDGSKLQQPAPTHGPDVNHCKAHPYRTAWDAIGDLDDLVFEDDLAVGGRWADLLPSVPEGHNYLFHTPRGGGEPLFGWRTRFWSFLLKLAKDQPSWTLQAQPGPATGPFHWRNRRLSVQEMARLQTFPEEWEFAGDYTSARRQIGNAVPAALGELLGLEIRRLLYGSRTRRVLRLTPAARPGRPRATPRRPVPAKYLSLRGSHADHPGHGRGPGALRRAAAPGQPLPEVTVQGEDQFEEVA